MDDVVAAMPAFNELGLVSFDNPGSPVELSSGSSGGHEDSEEMEEGDLEEVSPLSRPSMMMPM